jgi:hypothetical protein
MQTVKLRDDKLFLVESKEDGSVFLGLKPECRDGVMMCWFDTLRGRMKRGRLEASTPTSARFRGEDGATYTFRVCTLKDYNERVKPRVEGGPGFASEDELHRFYIEHFPF